SAGIGCSITIAHEGAPPRRVYVSSALSQIAAMGVEALERAPRCLSFEAKEQVGLQETTLERPDGKVVPVEVSIARIALADGRPIEVAFVRDVSIRSARESALRESENVFRTIAESCPDAITMMTEGRYVYANPAAALVLGAKTVEELARIDIMELVSEDR